MLSMTASPIDRANLMTRIRLASLGMSGHAHINDEVRLAWQSGSTIDTVLPWSAFS
jgi:hypothetical protein